MRYATHGERRLSQRRQCVVLVPGRHVFLTRDHRPSLHRSGQSPGECMKLEGPRTAFENFRILIDSDCRPDVHSERRDGRHRRRTPARIAVPWPYRHRPGGHSRRGRRRPGATGRPSRPAGQHRQTSGTWWPKGPVPPSGDGRRGLRGLAPGSLHGSPHDGQISGPCGSIGRQRGGNPHDRRSVFR